MSLAAERKLGDRIAREIYRDADFVDDPLLFDYVQAIWQPLQAAARARGELTADMDERFAWGLMLIRDRSVNAFALPGGYMGVHLGLIGMVASRDELASVLAHELSHVTQRHISRLTTKQGQQTPLLIAAMVLGALAASKSPNAANAVFAGSQAMMAQTQLNFSRDMEREADRIGYNVMTQAGYQPQAFVTMFEKLQQASRLNDSGGYPYLRSHPLTSERIADMQLRLGREGEVPAAAPVPSAMRAPAVAVDTAHSMMAARARILADPGVDVLRNGVAEAESAQPSILQANLGRQASVLYGAVLASIKLREFAKAQRFVQSLQSLVRGDPASARLARLLGVELALAMGDIAQAANQVDTAANDRPELFLLAQVAVQQHRQSLGTQASARISGHARELLTDVMQRLQVWVSTHPGDAGAWQQLAGVASELNQSLRALRAEAEVQAANLDLPAAVDRFKAAQDYARKTGLGVQPGDHIEASIIDTRLRQLDAQSRELTREQTLQR